MMLKNLIQINLDNLIGAVAAKRAAGYRFVTITCSDLGDAFDLLYHFDKDLTLENLLDIYTDHVPKHIAQIRRALEQWRLQPHHQGA